MRISWPSRFVIVTSVISVAAVAAIAGGGGARAAGTPATTPATSFGTDVELSGIAAPSGSSAWAVGGDDIHAVPTTLLEHWNGAKWTRITKGIPVYGYLEAVAATSADNAWATGVVENPAGTVTRSLVLHWNGKTWSQGTGVSIRNGSASALAASGNSVWAVGQIQESSLILSPLILHWTNGTWYVVPFAGSSYRFLTSVALTGKGAAWAVGSTAYEGGNGTSLLFHWSGDIWKQTPLPLHGGSISLDGIAAGLAGTVWADGEIFATKASADKLFVVRLNGKTWQQEPLGLPASQFTMDTITCSRGGTPWLALFSRKGTSSTLVLRWTGKAWVKIAVPNTVSDVVSIAAVSASDAWIVGTTASGKSIVLHWTGKTWS